MIPNISAQNPYKIYLRKLNGLGQKISVQQTMKVKQLKQLIQSLQCLQQSQLKQKTLNLIFKGKNITQKSQTTLKQLNICSDCIVHLIFVQNQECQNQNLKANSHYNNGNLGNNMSLNRNSDGNQKDELMNSNKVSSLNVNQSGSSNTIESNNNINININKPNQIIIRIIFNDNQHQFFISPYSTILDLKKKIALKLNLIYQSIVLSHLGIELLSDKKLSQYKIPNQTLISLKFNLQKPQKKKLQSRMVNSVTFSDENNEPNTVSMEIESRKNLPKSKLVNSSKSIDSDKQQQRGNQKRLTSLLGNNVKGNMYKSDINSFTTSLQGASKAALMFKNALHQKIIQTESVVSGSFSEDTSLAGSDPNSIMITIRNEQQTKQFVFQCAKSHQMNKIKQKILQLQNISIPQSVQISLEQDLFQSIDLNKSGCINLSQIIKKMGKQRAVFIYRVILGSKHNSN